MEIGEGVLSTLAHLAAVRAVRAVCLDLAEDFGGEWPKSDTALRLEAELTSALAPLESDLALWVAAGPTRALQVKYTDAWSLSRLRYLARRMPWLEWQPNGRVHFVGIHRRLEAAEQAFLGRQLENVFGETYVARYSTIRASHPALIREERDSVRGLLNRDGATHEARADRLIVDDPWGDELEQFPAGTGDDRVDAGAWWTSTIGRSASPSAPVAELMNPLAGLGDRVRQLGTEIRRSADDVARLWYRPDNQRLPFWTRWRLARDRNQ